MTFTESVKTCFTKYADFNGRASRSEYWWFVLFVFVVGVILSVISRPLGSVFYLAILIPHIAVAARRLHDTNRSGWMQLISLIPFIGWIIVIYFLVQEPKEPNRF
jgi:uncharacterized membrane protein YhaH (DUF805 family)